MIFTIVIHQLHRDETIIIFIPALPLHQVGGFWSLDEDTPQSDLQALLQARVAVAHSRPLLLRTAALFRFRDGLLGDSLAEQQMQSSQKLHQFIDTAVQTFVDSVFGSTATAPDGWREHVHVLTDSVPEKRGTSPGVEVVGEAGDPPGAILRELVLTERRFREGHAGDDADAGDEPPLLSWTRDSEVAEALATELKTSQELLADDAFLGVVEQDDVVVEHLQLHLVVRRVVDRALAVLSEDEFSLEAEEDGVVPPVGREETATGVTSTSANCNWRSSLSTSSSLEDPNTTVLWSAAAPCPTSHGVGRVTKSVFAFLDQYRRSSRTSSRFEIASRANTEAAVLSVADELLRV